MTTKEFNNYKFSSKTEVLLFKNFPDQWLPVTEVDFDRRRIEAGGLIVDIEYIKDIRN